MRFPFSFISYGVPAVLSGLLFIGLAAPAVVQAVQPASEFPGYEVDRRGEESSSLLPPGATALRSTLSRSPAWSDFVARHPGWVARWDVTSRTPERLQGPPAPIPGFVSVDTTNAEAAARAFLREGAMVWIPVDELTWVRTIADRGGLWVHFQQIHMGVPIWGSRVSVRLSRQGEVLLVTNRTASGLPSPNASRMAPHAAMEAAREALPGTPASLGDPVLTFLPIRRPNHYEQRLTWRYEFRTQDPPGAWVSFVDAADGTLLWRFNNVKYGEVSGQVSGMVEPVTADNDLQDRPFPHLIVTCFSTGVDSAVTVTGADGTYSLVTSGEVGRTVKVGLLGLYGVVLDANTGRVASFSPAVPDGDPARVDLLFDGSKAQTAERDAYYHVMVAHDYIQGIEPGFNLLDYPMPITVNIDRTCNAMWDGEGVNFYREGNGCINTARMADVVYHEYGHGITDVVYRPFNASGAMAEGFSDYFAATIGDEPRIGIGFRPGTILRRIDVDRVYPQDWVGEPHTDGLIMGSALWDLREALGAPRADSLFHFARYGYADNFDDYLFDLLMADDDNGNVYDGTPNLGTIAAIFRAHGIGDYGIHVSHDPNPDTEDATRTLPLTASFLSVFAIDPALVRIHISIIRGGATTTMDSVMTPTGGVREYTTVLPAQPPETIIKYYFTARDAVGTTVSSPENGEADPFVFQVGTDTTPPTIVHDRLSDQPVEIATIRVRATVTDNLDQPLRQVLFAQRRNDGPPVVASMTSGETAGYLAEISSAGLVLGDSVEYRISAEDGATVANAAADPPNGWHAFRVVRGFERDLEADDGGFLGDNDWVWGHSTQVEAYSGRNVWATNRNNNGYQNVTTSVLVSPSIDLSAFAAAGLVFRHFLRSEQDYDGGFVEVSSGGGRWTLLHPDPDYPAHIAAAQGTQGYSGSTGGWVPAVFDLSSHLGQTDVRIRFTFASDEGITGLGWYLDDVSVVERQVTGRPGNLQARGGKNGWIPLRWDPPVGAATSGSSPVTGYNVYRCAGKDGRPGLLNTEPVGLPQYRDTTAVNGELYQYNVSTLYGGRESPLSEPVYAMAYVAVYAADLPPIITAIDSVGVVDTTLVLRNSGTGYLEVNAYVADTAQTIDDVRIAIPMRNADLASRIHGFFAPPILAKETESTPSEWDTLATDVDDSPGIEPDLAALLVRQSDDVLFLRVTAHHTSMFPPLLAASMLIPLDTDQNIATGYSGGEFVILAGVDASDGHDQLAVLLDAGFNSVAGLIGFDVDAGWIEFRLDKEAVGMPDRIAASVLVTAGPHDAQVDLMPEGFQAPWLRVSPGHLAVGSGLAGGLLLELNSQAVPAGEYRAKVILETNDATQPVVEIPITFLVQTVTPIMLSGLTAEAGDEGVVLSWRTPADLHYAGFEVYRRQVSPDDEEETRITAEPLAPAASGEYRFVDPGTLPGRQYEYRVAGVGPNGERTFFGPLAVTTRDLEPPRALWLAPCAPNPARHTTAVRYGLPRLEDVRLTLHSPDGRLVRTVVEGAGRAAGYYVATWDGRDDRGHPVAAGVYLVRLESGRQQRTQKVLWVR
jgi:Zn-dependent metalloprotease